MVTDNSKLSPLLRKQQESLVPIVSDKPGYTRPCSINEAVTRGSSTLLTIRKKGGTKNLIGWVKGRLIELFTYLGGFETVTEYQIQCLANRICNKYYYITPAELDYFFLAFSNGEYGKLYVSRTINPQDIMQALIAYIPDMLDARGEAERQHKLKLAEEQRFRDLREPHGLEAWRIHCAKNGLDPATHRIATSAIAKDVNKVLNPIKDRKEGATMK